MLISTIALAMRRSWSRHQRNISLLRLGSRKPEPVKAEGDVQAMREDHWKD
jgi:hypothetical protein